MLHRHFAVSGFTGESDHFQLLAGMRCAEKVFPARVFDFFQRVFVLRTANVVHQIADLPRLQLFAVFIFDFFNDHGGEIRSYR